MSEFPDLADVLSHFMERAGVGDERLATLVNKLVGEKVGERITTRSSIQNWREGENRRSRKWQPLVAIAIVLTLSQRETNKLLESSGHPVITKLRSKVESASDKTILELWERTKQNRQKDILKEIAQDSVVQEKPTAVTNFLGREDKIQQIIANLEPGKVVALFGPGGIGKTAIAVEVIRRLTPNDSVPEQFPDGILFHNFYEKKDASEAFAHITERFASYRFNAVPASREAAQRALEDKQVLLVLDGAENATDLDSVIDIRGNCGILLSSRVRLDADVRFDIEALPKKDAVSLLKAWADERANTQAAINEICDLVGCLPLALRLIGSHLAKTKLNATEFVPLLREGRLELLDMDARQRESVLLVLKKSTAALSEFARLTLAFTGLLGFAAFTNRAIAAGHDLPVTDVYAPLGELVQASLLERPKERYRSIHVLVHQYAQTYLDDLVDSGHVTRLMTYFSHLAQAFTKRGREGLTQLALEQAHILSLVQSGKYLELWEPVLTLSSSIDEYLNLRGQWKDQIKVNEARKLAAQQSGNDVEQAQALIRTGIAQFRLSEWQEAEDALQEALTIAEKLHLFDLQGSIEANYGSLSLGKNDIEQAQRWYQRSLNTYKQTGNVLGQGRVLNGLGNVYVHQGKVQQAVETYELSLQAFQAADVPRSDNDMTKALDNLGICYRTLGDFEKAIAAHQQALDIFQETGDIHAEIMAIMRLGNVCVDRDQLAEAISYYERGRKLGEAINDRYALNNILTNLGVTYRKQHQYEEAIEVLMESKRYAEEINDEQQLGGALNSLAQVYRELGQLNLAIDNYLGALRCFRNVENANHEAVSLAGLADTYATLKEYVQADDYYHQALAIFENYGLVRPQLYVLKRLGLMCRAQDKKPQARAYWQQALEQGKSEWPEYQELLKLLNGNQ